MVSFGVGGTEMVLEALDAGVAGSGQINSQLGPWGPTEVPSGHSFAIIGQATSPKPTGGVGVLFISWIIDVPKSPTHKMIIIPTIMRIFLFVCILLFNTKPMCAIYFS